MKNKLLFIYSGGYKLRRLKVSEAKEKKVQRAEEAITRVGVEVWPNFFEAVPLGMESLKLIQHPVSTVESGLLYLNLIAFSSVKV